MFSSLFYLLTWPFKSPDISKWWCLFCDQLCGHCSAMLGQRERWMEVDKQHTQKNDPDDYEVLGSHRKELNYCPWLRLFNVQLLHNELCFIIGPCLIKCGATNTSAGKMPANEMLQTKYCKAFYQPGCAVKVQLTHIYRYLVLLR